MNYEELVHEFLDGTLETSQEEKLFLHLSASDDLRNEMKQQLAIRNAVRSDIKALTPRAESTLRIFNELGFTVPVPTTTPVAPPTAAPFGFWTKFAGIISKNTANIITGIASSVATAAIMMLLIKGGLLDFENVSNNSKNYSKSIPVIESKETQNPDIQHKSLFTDNNSLKKTQAPKVIYKYIYVNKDSQNNNNNDAAQNNEVEDENIINKQVTDNTKLLTLNSDFVPTQPTSPNSLFRRNKEYIESSVNTKNLPEIFPLYNFINSDSPTKFAVDASFSSYFYNTQERISPSNKQAFDNASLNLRYKFSEEVQVGFEWRNESFYQKFEGFDSENLYAYEQNPNISSFSLNIKYAPDDLNFSFIQPFVQTSLGGSKIGPVGRAMVGAKFNLFGNFSYIMSSEYSVLGFSHNSNWFLTSKWGLNFGFGLDF